MPNSGLTEGIARNTLQLPIELMDSMPSGQCHLRNAITENQKDRVREVFDIYSSTDSESRSYETPDEGLTIATGDIRCLGRVRTSCHFAGLAGPDGETPTAIMNLHCRRGMIRIWWQLLLKGRAMREVSAVCWELGLTPEAAGSSDYGAILASRCYFDELPTRFVDDDGSDTLSSSGCNSGLEVEPVYPGEATTVSGVTLSIVPERH